MSHRNALYAFIALAFGSPAAHADVFDDAWSCAVAVKEGVVDTAIIGGKALKFVATKPDCISRLGTPATAAPIGVVVGLANIGVLPKSQPSCSGKLYSTAAKPVAEALNATLGELGVLPDGAKDQLVGIAAGGIAGEVLAEIPGMDFVSGSLTCGCDLVDAGLSIDTIEKVLNTADNIGDKCGGPVWDAAKEVAGAVVDFAGDAAEEGVRQVSNLGDAIAGQTKHVPYLTYYDQNWAPNVETYAAYEFNQPNAWHGAKKWKEIWGPCVSYFDGHTQAEDTAQYTCDNMRSGGALFPKKYFGHELFQRVFEYEATVLANAEREKAYAEFADLKSGALPSDITGSACYANQAITLHSLLPAMRKQAIDAVFGIPSKEKTHNGIVVRANTPPALWANDTFGAYVFTYFPEVDAGQFHADAAKAIQLALADFNAEDKVRAKLKELVLDYYRKGAVCLDTADKNQQKINSLISQCPTQSCKNTISSNYQTCHSAFTRWSQENMRLLTATEYSNNKILLQNEAKARESVCVSDAEHSLVTEKNAVSVENMVNQCGKSEPKAKIAKDYQACAAAENAWYEKNQPTTGKFTPEYVETINEGWKGFNEACLEAAKTTFQSCRLSINDSSAKRTVPIEAPNTRDGGLTDASERLREREPIGRKDNQELRSDSSKDQNTSREPIYNRDPINRFDGQVLIVDPVRESHHQLTPKELRKARESRHKDQVPATDTANRDPVVPKVAPVTDADLPGCYVFGSSTNSRVYACTNPTAYDNCLLVVKRDSSVTCRMSKD